LTADAVLLHDPIEGRPNIPLHFVRLAEDYRGDPNRPAEQDAPERADRHGRLADRRAEPARLSRQLLLANAAVSAVAAVALDVAATGSVADVLAVFGVWAGITGAAQLVVVLRRRAQLGNQWPLLLANGVSIIGGVAFVLAAVAANDPKLSMLAIYAATGGVEFVVQAWLIARRRRHLTTLPAAA
jgi:hypothetical protein